MRSIDEKFYKTKRWKDARAQALQKTGGLCQRCLDKGQINSAYIVHHIVHLNEYNVTNEALAYGLENLEPLCQACHNEIHGKNKQPSRYEVNERGEIVIIPPIE